MRSPIRRAALPALSLGLLLAAGAAGCRQSRTTFDAEAIPMALQRPELAANVDTAFWQALSVLALEEARDLPLRPDQRSFLDALDLLLSGKMARADSAFATFPIDRPPDSRLSHAALIARTSAMQYEGRWRELATLLEREDVLPPTMSMGRAAILAWAHALRDAPTPVYEFPGDSIILPLEMTGFRTPVVTVVLNGKRRRFWLDTGATLTLVNSDIALQSGILPLPMDSLAVVSATLREVAVLATVIPRLEIGDLVITDLPGVLAPAEDMRLSRPDDTDTTTVAIEGIIGADVLRHLDIEIDMEQRRVVLRDPTSAKPARKRNLFWFGIPVVQLEGANDTPVFFVLDTGAQQTHVTPSLLAGSRQRQLRARTVLVGGLGGYEEMKIPVVEKLSLSIQREPFTFRNMWIRDHRRLIFLDPDGVLGADIHRIGRVRIDMTNGVYAVIPSENDPSRLRQTPAPWASSAHPPKP